MLSGRNFLKLLTVHQLIYVHGFYQENCGVYFGIDLTHWSLHLGHLFILMLLEGLRKRGNTIYIILGNFTTNVGDPSERKTQRVKISENQITSFILMIFEFFNDTFWNF